MSITKILYNLLLMPLQMLFEAVYKIAYSFIGNPGITIIIFSLAINFLVLPLYRRADALQEEERIMEQKLSRGVKHIKKTFRGDEQMMMLQTYYRQNGYRPTYVLRGATSLLLEIPFFIVAYRFLSNLDLLQGVSFGPIADLGKPDGMLTVAGLTVNVLPIIMTVINLVSSFLFTRGYSVKTKVQLYGMAVFFLVFLYTSPSGLVFYWTLNNAFSLVKTVFYKLKEPRKVLNVLAAVLGVGVFVLGLTVGAGRSVKSEIFFCAAGIILELPLLLTLLSAKLGRGKAAKESSECAAHPKRFFAGAIFLAVLTGLIIPSAVIAASPQEFIVPGYFTNPLWYLVSSLCLAAGTFVVWFGVFYSLADDRSKDRIEKAVWILCGVAIVNYMFFGKNMGLISSTLQYESGMSFTAGQQLINLAVVLGTALIMWLISRLIKKHTFDVTVIATLALCGLAVVNVSRISSSISQVSTSASDGGSLHTLSRNGKNVVVFMLDRGIDEYIPYIMNEKPELREQFDGFTYYPNTISYGAFTNMATPAIFGGYEYTPVENNKRDSESLESKHNESLKVMPVLFDNSGYDVTVCQPTYAGYQWTPDLSIYDEYPDIKAYNPTGMYSSELETKPIVDGNMRNFFAFGITKVSPLFVQPALYADGIYNYSSQDGESLSTTQTVDGIYRASGVGNTFMSCYNVLTSLPEITDVSEGDRNTFMMISNDTTHEPCMLQLPDYTPEQSVDNSAYADMFENGYVIDGKKLRMEDEVQVIHYQSNMAAMIQLGKWFDYLRENGVYDNTRIIIVSDHGRNLWQMDEAIMNLDDGTELDSEYFRALLMVKDFNATGFTTSDEFMTNADTPTLALSGLVDNPVNPFTGKAITDSEKTAHDQYILESHIWDVSENNGNTFRPGSWFALRPGDSWDVSNWSRNAVNSVLPEEAK